MSNAVSEIVRIISSENNHAVTTEVVITWRVFRNYGGLQMRVRDGCGTVQGAVATWRLRRAPGGARSLPLPVPYRRSRHLPVKAIANRNYYLVYLPLGIRTGPGWKNFSGDITPSFLKTMPFFITNCMLRSASMSVSGSPATAIRSAKRPGLMGPRSLMMSAAL